MASFQCSEGTPKCSRIKRAPVAFLQSSPRDGYSRHSVSMTLPLQDLTQASETIIGVYPGIRNGAGALSEKSSLIKDFSAPW